MHACMQTYIHTFIHTYIHTPAYYTNIHTYANTHMHVYAQMHVYACTSRQKIKQQDSKVMREQDEQTMLLFDPRNTNVIYGQINIRFLAVSGLIMF